jgi:hypothetical protein
LINDGNSVSSFQRKKAMKDKTKELKNKTRQEGGEGKGRRQREKMPFSPCCEERRANLCFDKN